VILHERNLNNATLNTAEESMGTVSVLDGRGGGEIALIGDPGSASSAINTVKVGDWITLRQSINLFSPGLYRHPDAIASGLPQRPWFYERMAWYRVLAVDDQILPHPSGQMQKSVTLAGPDWAQNDASPTYAIRIEGVEGVYRKTFAFN